MFRSLALVFLLICQGALAAPRQVTAIYHATRNGQAFANITDNFRQEGGRYKLESITEGIGVYGLFGKRRLASEGEVTVEGLRPSHFEQQQGDSAKKAISADFDWNADTIVMKSKGQATTVALEAGTQDVLSYAYQFMFRTPQGEEVLLPVTTGKKLRTYHYRIAERDVVVDTAAGKYKALHLVNAKEGGGEEKELWLGAEANHIPVRIVMQDESGAKIEQVLTSLHVE
jgi:hypothetical protein